jgi:serine/threonine protein kinase
MNRIRTLGQGGFGVVSLYQETNGQCYAVKQMLSTWNAHLFERFKREIQIMKSLVHKNIAKIITFSIDNNRPFYVMPFFKNGSLQDDILKLESKGEVYPIKRASAIVYYIADALRYAHSRGAIHRDLKPQNILFNDNNEPVIADWGIGKFIHKESLVLTCGRLGTEKYCAPEQWKNGDSDLRSDIYSLGVIYRELLTGSVDGQVGDARVNAIINKMTMENPDDRYQSMGEVMQAIKALGIVNTADPLKDFLEVVAVAAIGVGLCCLIAKLLK